MTLLTSDAERRARLLRAALGLVVLLAACHPVRGCAESQFDLAPESRLPKWFAVPAGLQRGDVTVELSYYGPLVGSARTAIVTLRTQQGKTLSEIVATLRGKEPLTLEPHSDTGPIPYPSYEVLTANGITEVIEHRRMEPVFYISDDPEVRRKLRVDQ
ncbi:MAG: hypothetical protein DMF84_00200 [Acidobacteria bacterium]|nr:MAG: hypothetical protein DMF84_00200 [Acidobacteriota bacterium]